MLSEILRELHQIMGATETVDPEKVKSRLVEHSTYFVGKDSSKRAFVHVNLTMRPGRPPEVKTLLGEKLHVFLTERIPKLVPSTIQCSITLEIREVNESFFFRTSTATKDH
jgi:5-carboxymethyl-2-hydroxymuconate isomerase